MAIYTIDLSPVLKLTAEQFERLCEQNPEVKLERSAVVELVVVSPWDGETGRCNAEITADFVIWSDSTNLGVVFDSSTGFRLPGGGTRSPDVARIERSRWEALTSDQRRRFPPICPDFVLELASPTDTITTLRAKMQEYLASGVQLGWLINPEAKQVEIYRPNQTVEVLQAPERLSGESILSGFELYLGWLWQAN